MKIVGLLSPALLCLFTVVRGHTLYDIEGGQDPMVHAALDALDEVSGIEPNPDAFWMSQFLNLIKDKLPHQAVEFDALKPNIEHLHLLLTKGYIKAFAKGEIALADIPPFPDVQFTPLLLKSFMPTKPMPESPPVIIVSQEYNGKIIQKQIVLGDENNVRKKRSVNGQMEEIVMPRNKAYQINPDHLNDDIPHYKEEQGFDFVTPEFDDNGEIVNRKKRDAPPNVGVFPPKDVLLTVKALSVKTENGTIVFPNGN